MSEVQEEIAKVSITCGITGKVVETKPLKSGEPALPNGWKRIGGKVVSDKAWHDKYCLRTLAFPVDSVLTIGEQEPATLYASEPDPKLAAYRVFRDLVRLSWRISTRTANWMLSEMFSLDREPWETGDNGKEKLGKVPDVKHLPAIGRAKFPEMESQSFYSLLQKVQAKYREHRWEIHTGRESLPSYRYPTPLPVPANIAEIRIGKGSYLEKGMPIEVDQVQVQIPFADQERGRGRVWYTVGLTCNAGFSKFLKAVKRVLDGDGLFGEVSFYERAAGGGNALDKSRDTPTANNKATRIFCAITVWLPKDSYESDREMKVATGEGSLFRAEVEGREIPWTLNEDQVLGWVHARRRVNQRFSEDRKFERRRSREDKADLSSAQHEACQKFDNRINDFLHKASAMLVGLAVRNRVRTLTYNDNDHQFAPQFPWHKLKTLVQQKCFQNSITFIEAEPEVVESAVPRSAEPELV